MPQSYADRKHFFIVGALVLIGTVVLGFFLLAILPIKAQASVQAEPIRWLFQLHLWLIAFLFSLVVVICAATKSTAWGSCRWCWS
mgnify:CR=1 FL=1